MRRHNKLNIRERAFQSTHYIPLPFRMQMHVNLIYKNNPFRFLQCISMVRIEQRQTVCQVHDHP